MSQAQRYHPIYKDEFERFLKPFGAIAYTQEDYEIEKKNSENDSRYVGPIQEYCYKIPITYQYCIKIFSSIGKKTGKTRDRGKDSIKFVVADAKSLLPIRPRFKHAKRIVSWRKNVYERVFTVLGLPANMRCKNCKTILRLKWNRPSKILFLGCPNHKEKGCKGDSIPFIQELRKSFDF